MPENRRIGWLGGDSAKSLIYKDFLICVRLHPIESGIIRRSRRKAGERVKNPDLYAGSIRRKSRKKPPVIIRRNCGEKMPGFIVIFFLKTLVNLLKLLRKLV
jgi:hypothetical protein